MTRARCYHCRGSVVTERNQDGHARVCLACGRDQERHPVVGTKRSRDPNPRTRSDPWQRESELAAGIRSGRITLEDLL